ncbi:TetR/AcrR family transcriptional regulator [Spongiactinospora sp. TRM90649]|uniref:TetR/AcrR family transcriptional regulator n=1 Tax=Spongiactinospora sp. TRM90649 TaxID=3031114 RepID=UPI0023F8B273|nr:TetR/AcrR family transcriptional regulator [Spongiactinospora sp. TRM90649]MDF5757402.1 TetR/AcrR family transcriptional regulator [Spongiactinospora sp. TRM90649]
MRPQHELGTRERIVRTTSRLMQQQGYEATGLKQISQEAKATLGSVYHFFPGGKRELAIEAIRHGDREFAEFLRAAFDRDDDPAAAMVACTRDLASGLRESGWLDGCPVTTTALESAGREPAIQQAAEEAYENWRTLVREKLERSGFAADVAHDLAHTVINLLEGAELSAQVARSEAPLEIAGRHLARLIDSYR